MKAIFSFLVVLACLGVVASTSSSSSPVTGSSTSTAPNPTTGSSTPAVTSTTTPNGAAFVQCSVFITMAVATLALLRL